MTSLLILFGVIGSLPVAPISNAAQASTVSIREVRAIAATEELRDTTLVKASDGVAVVQLSRGALEKLRVGDVVSRSKAIVKDIVVGRITLEETFTGKDGKPNRALIVIKEGERGGTRYLDRPDTPAPIDSKPVPPTSSSPYGAKPAPKKPPQL